MVLYHIFGDLFLNTTLLNARAVAQTNFAIRDDIVDINNANSAGLYNMVKRLLEVSTFAWTT